MRLIAIAAMLFIGMVAFNAGSTQVHAQQKEDKKAQGQKGSKQSKKTIVKSGETLTKIAKKHKTTYQRIFYANEQIKDPDVIYVGEQVRIPANDEKLKPRPLGTSAPGILKGPTSVPRQKIPARKTAANLGYGKSGGVWDKIAQCESGGNWSINTGNGYYGGLQFTVSSWRAAGGKGLPSAASKAEQIARAKTLQSKQGWGAWPACTSKLGIR